MKQEKSPEDEAFEALERNQKTATETIPTSPSDEGDELTIAYMCGRSDARNAVLEEVAKEFDKMKALGDTAASFAAFVRGMKR